MQSRLNTLLNRNQILILLLLVIILIVNNWALPLWDQDEAAYAGFGKTMIEKGDFLIPDYYFSHDHRKTPLHFWNISWSFLIFGYNEFAVRFPSFLATLGTLLLVLYQTRKWLGLEVSFKATVVLGTSILVTSLAKVSVTDATLLFFSTLSAFGLINNLHQPNLKWGIFFYLGISLGLLVKGPPILIFTGLFSTILFLFHPNRHNLLKLHPWFFLPISFIPVTIWGYLTIQQDGGEFLNWMYDWYVKRRVNGAVYGQEGPIGMHFLFMFGFFFLSAMYFLKGFWTGIVAYKQKNYNLMIFGAWVIAGWFLYEFSPSKLPAYIIPAHVGIAILIGQVINDYESQDRRPHIVFSILHYLLNFGLSLGLIFISYFIQINDALTISLVMIGSAYFFLLTLQIIGYKKPNFFNFQLTSNALLLIGLWGISPLFTKHINSSMKVSEYILPKIKTDAPIIIAYAPGQQPSLPFYLSKNNNPIIIEYSTPKVRSIYDSISEGAFILNHEQDSVFQLLYPNYSSEIISSQLIDRKVIATYYIHIKL